jgi:hypothetical protein
MKTAIRVKTECRKRLANNMVGKLRHARAVHEAGHAVIARKLGLFVKSVDARNNNPNIISASAAHAAISEGTPARIRGCEKDAIVALAGVAANKREFPRLHLNLFADDDADAVSARSAICKIVLLRGVGLPTEPQDSMMTLELTEAEMRQVDDIYFRLLRETEELVERHWSAIERVRKHLERHGHIDSQDELDDLIVRGERFA